MVQLSTSVLQDHDILTIKKLNESNTDYLHIDVMDGHFVSNEAFSITEIEEVHRISIKPLDVHLMVHHVDDYVDKLIQMNVHSITFHYETMISFDTIKKIRNHGIKCGISVKPKTEIEKIFYLLDKIDFVLIMSVEPGEGGQEFDQNAIPRIKSLKQEIINNDYSVLIAVDGGINDTNLDSVIKAGADILVVGSYITSSDDIVSKINNLKSLMNKSEKN